MESILGLNYFQFFFNNFKIYFRLVNDLFPFCNARSTYKLAECERIRPVVRTTVTAHSHVQYSVCNQLYMILVGNYRG
jgi:hypothetical protein